MKKEINITIFALWAIPIGIVMGCIFNIVLKIIINLIPQMQLYVPYTGVRLIIDVAIFVWGMIIFKNIIDYKFKNRRKFGRAEADISSDKRKAMYPDVPKRYLSKIPDGFTLGKCGRKYFRLPVDTNDITHACIIGAPGSMKSSTLLNALIYNFNLAKEKFTVFALDVKPELAKKSIDTSSEQCHVFNPSGFDEWGWDVWYGLNDQSTEDEIIERADSISRSIIVNNNPDSNEFFYQAAQNLLVAFLAWGFTTGLKFTETIIQVISVPVQDLIATVCLDEKMKGHDSITGILKGYDGKDSNAMQDVEMTLRSELRIFQTKSVRYQFDENNKQACPMDLTNNISVFLAIPDNLLKQYAAIFRLITQQTLNYLSSIPEWERANEEVSMIWLLIDEFGSIGNVPDILDALARLRSRKVSIWLAVQGLSQLDMVYGHDGSRAIIDNTETTLVFSCKDKATAEMISAWCGTYEETKISKNKKPGKMMGGCQSLGESSEFRNVMDVVDIMNLRKNKELLVFDSGNRYLIEKCPYFMVPVLKNISDHVNSKKIKIGQKRDRI